MKNRRARSARRFFPPKGGQNLTKESNLPLLRPSTSYSSSSNIPARGTHNNAGTILALPNPGFVTGLVDAEGCFYFSILKNNNTIGWAVRPSFHIAAHKNDRALLEAIQAYFIFFFKKKLFFFKKMGVGGIYKQGKDSIQYRVSSLNDLITVIVPHFIKYPALFFLFAPFLPPLMKCIRGGGKEGGQKNNYTKICGFYFI
jgi:hypothetical protein